MRPTSDVAVVDPDDPDPRVIARAAALLRAGRLVAFPTETVYGLGADARNPDALRAVFTGKGRPATDPLILHVPDVSAARAVSSAWPDSADLLARSFWPGPLTLVVPRAPDIPAAVAAGRPTVAVRVPAHPVAAALLRRAEVPVAAPSANRFGRISPTTAAHVVEELAGVYDLLLDGGPTTLGVESSVVDLTGDVPSLLRPGGVTLEDLRDVLGRVDHQPRSAVEETEAARGPGEFLRHYAPLTPLVLVEAGADVLARLAAELDRAGAHVGLVELDAEPDAAARALYASLRAADGDDSTVLLARFVDPTGIGRAVNDRLYRAAHGRVVTDAGQGTVERVLALTDPDR